MITTETHPRTGTSTLWRVDPDRTVVEFAVPTFWGMMTVHGRFERFDGWYEVGPDGGSIELTIDGQSVDTSNRTRDRHLRSADFFRVAEHPLIRFQSTRVEDAGDGTLRVEGGLEAAGVVVPLAFDAVAHPAGEELQIEAEVAVDHRDFGMSSGLLGMIRPPARLHVQARLTSRS